MWDRHLLRLAFERALHERIEGQNKKTPSVRALVLRAQELYALQTGSRKLPSLSTLERLAYNTSAAPHIRSLVETLLGRRARVDRKRLLIAFREAAQELEDDLVSGRAKRLQVARRAHALYAAASGKTPPPSLHTFERLIYGRNAAPDVRAILDPVFKRRALEKLRRDAAQPAPAPRARLDRERLRAVFREAVERLESRLLQGQARPLQVARRAYALYTRDTHGASPRPSPHTFQRLIYGKDADPEIMSLIRAAVKGKDGTP